MENLLRDCGDFIIRRSDGVYAYQLAVTVDDGAMGITQVVRGRDLLFSTPRQLYLYQLLGLTPPEFYHVPLLLAPDGRRLSKREHDLDMGALRARFSPEALLGWLAAWRAWWTIRSRWVRGNWPKRFLGKRCEKRMFSCRRPC